MTAAEARWRTARSALRSICKYDRTHTQTQKHARPRRPQPILSIRAESWPQSTAQHRSKPPPDLRTQLRGSVKANRNTPDPVPGSPGTAQRAVKEAQGHKTHFDTNHNADLPSPILENSTSNQFYYPTTRTVVLHNKQAPVFAAKRLRY